MFDPVSFAAGKAASGGGEGEPSAYIKSASVSGNKLTLTKKDGSKVEFDMTTVVNTINEAISALETAVDGKQDAISDLSTIRTGAGKGATAVQPADVSHETWTFTLEDDTTVTKEVCLWTGAE